MIDSIDEFLRAGVAKYAEAQETVEFFQQRVLELLEQVARQSLVDGPCAMKGESGVQRRPGGHDAQWWISLFADVDLRLGPQLASSRLELGVWWNARIQREVRPCIVYANLINEGAPPVAFALVSDPQRPRIEASATENSKKWARVVARVESPADLRQDALDVLAALKAGLRPLPSDS